MDISDQELVKGLKDSKRADAFFNQLVGKYQERLYWHIRKIVLSHDDTDDVLQNTFLKVWRNIGNFREESTLFTWLYRIATNESLTFLNQKKRHSLTSMNEVTDYLQQNLRADEYFDGDDIQLKLQQAILTLPEKQRLVFNLRYFEEMPYQEMSEILETSVGALKASYHHAARKVEDYLSGLE